MSEKQRFELRIEGMTCSGCAKTVKSLLEKAGFEVISVDHEQGKAEIIGNNASLDTGKTMIEAAGYKVTEIKT